MGVLDWVQLGLSAANAAASMRTAQQIEEMRLAGAAQASVVQLLTEYRNFVFENRQRLRQIAAVADSDPLPALALTLVIEKRFESAGLSSSIFTEFRDKEFVEETQAELSQALASLKRRLGADENAQAEEAAQAMFDMSLLNAAIQESELREALSITEGEWAATTSQKNKRILFSLAALILAGLICPIGPVAPPLSMMAASLFPTLEMGFVAGMIVLLGFGVVAIVGFVAAAVLFLTRVSGRRHELERQRKDLQRQFVPADVLQRIIATFGNHNSQHYRALRESREKQIQMTLSSLSDNPLLSP